MADNTENILVEFDYNNITIIDPNKVIDQSGKIKERNVRHEELVMYVNLECAPIPRTKMVIGASNSNNLREIATKKLNFLNPGDKKFLDNAYTDEITGKDTLAGEGVNQQKIDRTLVTSPNGKPDRYFYSQSTKTGGQSKSTDNGLLGITSVQIKVSQSYESVVTINLVDIKGRALFESGNDSPYSVFFNLPYPMFYLTIKGYYGKAVKMPLTLMDFTSSYNISTGNFDITLTLNTYKYGVLNDVFLGDLYAVPHMYKSVVNEDNKLIGNTNNSKATLDYVSYGYQKIKEVYSEYKNKGLVDKDFPEITVIEMKYSLERFITNTLQNYTKTNLDPIRNARQYKKDLDEYRGKVFYYNVETDKSWFNKYIDQKNYFILTDGTTKIYPLALSYTDDINSELSNLVATYNDKLNNNSTFGSNNQSATYQISNPINDSFFKVLDIKEGEEDFFVDFEATAKLRTATNSGNTENDLRNDFRYNLINGYYTEKDPNSGSVIKFYRYYKFTGEKTFISETDKMLEELEKKKEQIIEELNKELFELIKKQDNNPIGFVPTLRNVLAVIFASAEAYLRLLDEVHVKAWDRRYDNDRKAVIFDPATSTANPDVKVGEDQQSAVVYPWPTVLISTLGNNGNERYQPIYPLKIKEKTKADNFDVWPEVEFVEEYIKGITQKLSPYIYRPKNNTITSSTQLSLNAIEFPTNNNVYNNKEITKFFYEIYERLILSSFYSMLVRTTNNNNNLGIISEAVFLEEASNIVQSVASENLFLREILTNDFFDSNNFLQKLKEFSNNGAGESWQNFIRGIFNTKYIKSLVDKNGFEIGSLRNFNTNVLGVQTNVNNISNTTPLNDELIKSEEKICDYISGTTSTKNFSFVETYPFVVESWVKDNLQSPYADIFDTTKNLVYNKTFKTITNFEDKTLSQNTSSPKPFSSYNFNNVTLPVKDAPQNITNLSNLNEFYKERYFSYGKQLPTEGCLTYSNDITTGLTMQQTVSILNTPFFINSIQEGVNKFRNFDQHPYKVPAYLFLNSLPLSTLREKYTIQNPTSPDEIKEYLNYIFATLKKYGAIHKIPLAWILKIGSVWHRYKYYVETGTDILNECWKPFNYLENFDPINSASTQNYSLTLNNNQNFDFILEKNSNIGTEVFTQMNTGFYPKTINDFNVFFQGSKIFTGYTNSDIQDGVDSGLGVVNVDDSNIVVGLSGDPKNLNRIIQLNPWSVYVLDSKNKKYCYPLPSHGSQINQTKNVCINNDNKLILELSGNTSVYDGSVRLFWAAPNYGYFETNKILKPTPNQYLKKVFNQQIINFQSAFKQNDKTEQENFSLNFDSPFVNGLEYSDISEIFSVFDKNILDFFENSFLDFSRSKYDFKEVYDFGNQSNFQMLMSEMMKIEVPNTGATPSNFVSEIQTRQLTKLASTIKSFMNYEVLVKYGNPSNFDKQLFYTFSNKDIQDPLLFESYQQTTPDILPTSAGTPTLSSLISDYPDEWKSLLKNVGFSEISKIKYTNTGSTVFDFFIDFNIAFTEKNIENCSQIIKLYATQKYLNSDLKPTDFLDKMTRYLDDGTEFINKVLDNLFKKVGSKLTKITTKKESEITKLNGKQTQLNLYETFKTVNDKWISGNDYKTKCLFEDVLLLDRASRNIGDKVIIDINKVRNLIDIEKYFASTKLNDVIKSVIKASGNFAIVNVPNYVNFYGAQTPEENSAPKPEGSLEQANTLFGTFLNVDYRDSSTKMLCYYVGKESKHLSELDNFKSDSFDFRKFDNPLSESQAGKKDFYLSNKVIGFNVDFGPQNQSLFTNITVSQKSSTPTAESLRLLTEMSQQASNRTVAAQNLSLYNVYKLRSYNANVTMLGNALIQPQMYFNLRYIPMFNGPYMITDVTHDIGVGKFTTSFNGVRQAAASYDINTDYIQALKSDLLEQVEQEISKIEEQEKNKSNNKITNNNDVVTENTEKIDSSSNSLDCSGITRYSSYTKISDPPKVTESNLKQTKQIIENLVSTSVIPSEYKKLLKYAIFSQIYLQSFRGTQFQTVEHNFIGVDLKQNWGTTSNYFKNSFFCAKKKDDLKAYAVFEKIDDNISFLISRWEYQLPNVNETPEDIAKFIILNNQSVRQPDSLWNGLNDNDKRVIVEKVGLAIGLYEQTN